MKKSGKTVSELLNLKVNREPWATLGKLGAYQCPSYLLFFLHRRFVSDNREVESP